MCTLEKRGNLFILTLTGPGKHRLNPALIDAIRSTLSRVREEPVSPCSALITTSEGKFFSNGFDLAWAQSSRPRLQLMESKLRALIVDLVSLPMPTIAAVNGHASAAGFILALSHDYVLMRKDRGFLYMSELDIGLVIPEWFIAIVKMKVGSPSAWRDIVLRAPKLTAMDGLKMGIADSAHDGPEETVEAAVMLGEELVARKWDGFVYGQNRAVAWTKVINKIESDEAVDGGVSSTGSRL